MLHGEAKFLGQAPMGNEDESDHRESGRAALAECGWD
jgi:hypothetical protein